jgi:hypothetical protein
MPVRRGVHLPLEEAADDLLRADLKNCRSHAEHDVLTPWKLHDRLKREVYTTEGTPDGSIRKGNYYRAHNPARPELSSREGHAPPRSRTGYSSSSGGYHSIADGPAVEDSAGPGRHETVGPAA